MTLAECFIKKAEDTYKQGENVMKITMAKNYEGQEPKWFAHFEGQMQAQEVYLSLTPDGVVTVDYSGEINRSTMPASVWDVLELRWTLPCDINGDGVASLVEEIKPDLLTILKNWDTDGSHGELLEQGLNASYDIECKIRDIDHELYCSPVATLEDALEFVDLSDLSRDSEVLAKERIEELIDVGAYPVFSMDDLTCAIDDMKGYRQLEEEE